MAGIGFTLRKLTRQDNFIGVIRAGLHTSFVVSGPWIFTIMALAGMTLVSRRYGLSAEMPQFMIVVIYNFAFSLIFSAPITMVLIRYTADRVYEKNVTDIPGNFMGALALSFAVQAPLVVYFYGFMVNLDPTFRLVAIFNYFAIAGIWLSGVFLSALKDYNKISFTFLCGMGGGLLGGWLLLPIYGGLGLLIGFTCGLSIIFFGITAQVFTEYPYRAARPFAFLDYYRKYWELAIWGFFGNAALWADKLLMWMIVPERQVIGDVMIYFPRYDSAMFLSYLSIIPALSIFILQIETSFFITYQDFFRELGGHASFSTITTMHQKLIATLVHGLRNFIIIQGIITLLFVLGASALFETFDLSFDMISIFQFGTIGAFFQTFFLFMVTILSYFDLRRTVMWSQIFFFVVNVTVTLLSLELGPRFYGYGFMASCVLTVAVCYTVAYRKIVSLPYLVFIDNNPSVKWIGEKLPEPEWQPRK